MAPKDVELIFPTGTSDDSLSRAILADLAIVVVGEHPIRSGEASSISTLDLPAGQREMLETFADNGIPVVLIVLAGRPLAIGREANLAQAVLYAWHPGVEGGYAIAEVLFGQAAPGGRLPVTFPRTVGQVPIYYNHRNTGRPPVKGSFCSRYIDLPIGPLYPFGFGLSYTTFAYANLSVAAGARVIEVAADVTNTGSRAGVEVAQLYVRDLVGSLTRPVKELKGFQRVALHPGQTQRVRFTVAREDLAFTGIDEQPTVEPGEFHVWVGSHSAEGLAGEFVLT